MARLDVNRSGELEVFVRAVELGGFSAAARALGMAPSAVSKLVARLETRLGARLLNRSTRNLQLTPEGCVFYERGVRVLAELDETERSAAVGATPRGRLRVHANVPLGRHYLVPLLPAFLDAHPDITVDLVLTDQVVDLLEQRTDVAIRSGPLKDSQMVARKLGDAAMVIVGAPAYLERRGTPRTPAELRAHNRLGFGFARAVNGWPLVDPLDGRIEVPVDGNALASDGDTLRQLTLAGVGLARLAAFQVRDDVRAGRLTVLLDEFAPGDTEPVNAVYLGRGGPLPARVRAWLDFLAQHVRIE
ncbi:LysR family transcriptional regulator [Paraburkholderia sp. MMS20-SJTR3]|uniref:LysR family transcriptional regulator n=1 Tax=Paraburkholderia sejongensis TaxID=2886946 RepID=A0ABS8K3T6_9BURK|nr:LysR family transcriptional regulator [Paraburkholderia sp. MMS20-SJTR3]MCC8396645.1 LysR family transcriptional regulator [Paraburkholderia sp. MMS20-SJTR3]